MVSAMNLVKFSVFLQGKFLCLEMHTSLYAVNFILRSEICVFATTYCSGDNIKTPNHNYFFRCLLPLIKQNRVISTYNFLEYNNDNNKS